MEGRGGLRSVGGIVSRGWKNDKSSGESSDRYSQIRLFFGIESRLRRHLVRYITLFFLCTAMFLFINRCPPLFCRQAFKETLV